MCVGAIFYHPNRRETLTTPSLLNSRRYTAAAMASFLESENVYLSPYDSAESLRRVATRNQYFSSLGITSLHQLQQCFMFFGSGSSQPRGSLRFTFFCMITSCCSISFPSRMTGNTSPRGLYTEFITERTPLHVKGFTGSET